MTNIINPNDYAPTGVNEEQWLQGKPTRNEVAKRLGDAMKVLENIISQKVGGDIGTIFTLCKINGMQIESLVRAIDVAVGEYAGTDGIKRTFKDLYDIEFHKTRAVIDFLDKLSPYGEKGTLPMAEKINLVRAWNAQENVVKIKGPQFNLDEYIKTNMSQYTKEEVEELNKEFEMNVVYIPTEVVQEKG